MSGLRPIECPRHGEQFGAQMYPAERCSHIDNRFVVQIRTQASGWFVDYVEDVPGGFEVIVEAHSPQSEEARDRLWEALVAKMAAGEPPQPDV